MLILPPPPARTPHTQTLTITQELISICNQILEEYEATPLTKMASAALAGQPLSLPQPQLQPHSQQQQQPGPAGGGAAAAHAHAPGSGGGGGMAVKLEAGAQGGGGPGATPGGGAAGGGPGSQPLQDVQMEDGEATLTPMHAPHSPDS